MSRRRHRSIVAPSGLLDTLVCALGGVIFISLLVVILVKTNPSFDSELQEQELQKLRNELDNMPALVDLERRRDVLHAAIQSFPPDAPRKATDKTVGELRKALDKPNEAPPIPLQQEHHIPKMRPISPYVLPYVAIIKDGKVYLGGRLENRYVDPALQNGFNTMPGLTLHRENHNGGTALRLTPTQRGLPVEQAVERIKAESFDPDYTRLSYYVYPDSVAEFHQFRKAMLSVVPYHLWEGVPEKGPAYVHIVRSNSASSF